MKFRLFKILIAFVAVTYVFSTIGVSVISHYCGGELEEVSLFTKPGSCCGGEEEEDMEDGCCKNEITHVSFQKDFTYFQLVKDCKVPVIELPLFNFQTSWFDFNKVSGSFISVVKEYPPPNLVQQDIVSVSVLRI